MGAAERKNKTEKKANKLKDDEDIKEKPEVAEVPLLSLEDGGNSSPYDSEADSDSYSEVLLPLMIRNSVFI